jgi:hypothetical protein
MDVPITVAWIGEDQVHSMAGDYPLALTGIRTLRPSRGAGVAPHQTGVTGADGARPP